MSRLAAFTIFFPFSLLTRTTICSSQSAGYDPKKSRVSDDTLADFFRSQLTGEITEIPGIGPAAAKALASGEDDDKITK